MEKHNVAFCPTLAAGEAYSRYFGGWQPTARDEGTQIRRDSFKAALKRA